MKRLLVICLSLLIGCAGSPLPPEFQNVPKLPVESVLYYLQNIGTGYRKCSAVAIEPGLALTAGHCVKDPSPGTATPGQVNTYSMETWAVLSAKTHPSMDLASIGVSGNPDRLPVAEVATELPEPGSVVYLLGYGCPSYDPNLPMVRQAVWPGRITLEGEFVVLGPVCPGDSGGGLFNAEGELLGILVSRGPGVAFAVPAGYADKLLD